MTTSNAKCELCDLPLDQCQHGLSERRRRALVNSLVRVSPRNMAHLDGCMHKGDDEDYSGWGEIQSPGAWEHLCSTVPLQSTGKRFVADLVTTAGNVIGLEVTDICAHCRDHGSWI